MLTKRNQQYALKGPAVSYTGAGCIHEQFVKQARKNPGAVAVTSDTGSISYAELDNLSSRLASLIGNSAVGKDPLIGLSMSRSLNMVVGVFGALKAGCAYVPLDPAYPKERLVDMLDDTQVSVVLTDSELKGLFSSRSVRLLCLDEDWESSCSVDPVLAPTGPDSLAYVIYTSGSTGRPKGVCCTHQGVMNLLSDFQDRQRLAPGDICAWWTSLNFDVSVYEIFAPLVGGATLIITPDSVRPDGPRFMDWLHENKVNSAYIPPFMVADLYSWIRNNPGRSRLRRLLVGVEPIPESVLLAIQQAVPGLQIINGYGPTEATVCATLYSIGPSNRLHDNTPIGKPVQNTTLYILDEEGNFVPEGEEGELFIGGLGLARGYLNRPDLSAERFVRDPFSQISGARLYKTGDRVRLIEDGNLEFLGRTDSQVKLRGFRIELGEIETQLRRIDAIREAVVLLREDEPGNQRLVAYVALYEGKSVSLRSMKDHLNRYIPDYMLPSAFVRLDRIPSTPNGKTDRDALSPPNPDNMIREKEKKFVAPRTQVESTLAGFFQGLLGIDTVSVSENFFELGGHSLLAAQLVSRIREAFGIQIPIATVFRLPTIESLAKEVEPSVSKTSEQCVSPIKPCSDVAGNPLSFFQRRIWFLDQLEPSTPAYNIPLAYRLKGPLDLKALDHSLRTIVNRQHSLRTIFENRNAQPVQVVSTNKKFSLEFVDLVNVPEAGREAEALMLCNEESHREFNLYKGPLFRSLVIWLAPEEHILCLTVHHIVSDGWSMGVIVKELMALYSGLVSGQPSSLRPLPIQYTDFARWQIDWMNSETIGNQLSYWKERFKSIPDPLELPTDRQRPAIRSNRGAGQSMLLPEQLCLRIRDLAAKRGTTLFMVLLAAFKTLLYRYSRQGDQCVGTFIANREWSELEDIVGFFVNSIAIRTDLSDDPTFEELLRRVKDNALGAFANQDLPFEKLLEDINPERSLSLTPLFQVMLVLQNFPLPELELDGLECEEIYSETFRSNFDLTMWLYEIGDRIKILLDYSADLFDESTIRRMLEHFEILLNESCAYPDKKLSQMAILSEKETRIVVDDFSGNLKAFSMPTSSVLSRFEEQVEMGPKRIALIDRDSTGQIEMTYEELNRHANKIANAISGMDLAPEAPVGVLMDRGSFLIAAIFGILKAGRAYAPIDPKYPLERISFILNDTATPLVITDNPNLPKLQEAFREPGLLKTPETLCLDKQWYAVEGEDGGRPVSVPDLGDPAYVIYTSGSTGQPKGVLIEHGSLAAFTQSAIDLYGLHPDDRVLQFASPTFDSSVEEIFSTLSCGAALVIRSDDMLRSTMTFLNECNDNRITVLDLPTAFWQQLTRAVKDDGATLPQSLRAVIIGGEEPSQDMVLTWKKVADPNIQLFNTYGPTEATVVATAIELSDWKPKDPMHGRVPIGRPLAHVSAFVLDPHMRPTPIGVPGELFIGGAALARGYLNLPARTSESFVSDPLNPGADGRLYKTGDLVRFLDDGSLEFLGRVDRQVKIRGFRVELGEVEAALRSNPEILEAVTVARKSESGSVQLTAYIVPRSDTPILVTKLRTDLLTKLPDFMIPSSFVIMESLPVTVSGKIDTKALPDPKQSLETPSDNFILPRNPVEEILTDIWRKVFGRDRVGILDNFFDLGGHSLLSLQIIDQVNKAGLYLTPAQFIQNPTIERQAQVISAAHPSSEWSCLVELQPHGTRPPLYFLHSTPGDVLGYMNLINKLGADQPCFGFQSLGLKDADKSHFRFEDMANFYIDEMLAFQPEPPYILVGWCYGGLIAAEMALQMKNRGREPDLIALIETPFPAMESGQTQYYWSRLESLFRMGPKGWILYVRNKIKYLRKIKGGEIDKLFSLELDHGPLANRSHVYRNNVKAINQYRMKDYVSCPVRIFQGDELVEGYIPDMEELWVKKSKNVRLYEVPGNHISILKEPGVSIVAQKLKECLEEVQPS